MRKKGYTLAEVLIAVTIIGVVAATILPMVNKIKPDETKIKYLQTYDAISSVIADLAKNRSYFPVYNINDTYNEIFVDRPFLNTIAIDLPDNRNPNGDDILGENGKICRLLHAIMGNEEQHNCSNLYNPIAMNSNNFSTSFTTKNGITMMIYTNNNNPSENSIYQTDIYFDINGNEAPNCFKVSATENSCPQPDRFKMKVAANGYIEPGDRVGNGYLLNRANTRKSTSNPPLVGDVAIEGNDLMHYRRGKYNDSDVEENETPQEEENNQDNSENNNNNNDNSNKPWEDKEPLPYQPDNCLNGGNSSNGKQDACRDIYDENESYMERR